MDHKVSIKERKQRINRLTPAVAKTPLTQRADKAGRSNSGHESNGGGGWGGG